MRIYDKKVLAKTALNVFGIKAALGWRHCDRGFQILLAMNRQVHRCVRVVTNERDRVCQTTMDAILICRTDVQA